MLRPGNLEYANDDEKQVHQFREERFQGKMACQPGRSLIGDEDCRQNQPQRSHHRFRAPLRDLQACPPSLHRSRTPVEDCQQRAVPRAVCLLREGASC